jgi:hypothetical protein
MLQECGAADGVLDPACAERWEREIRACFANCQGEPPPPPEPTCLDTCKRQVLADVEACLQAGGSREECWQGYEAKIQECLVAECEEPPPPPPVPCQERCAQLQERLIEKCTTEEGQIDPGCQQMILREIEACMAGCSGEPPPPPPEPVACEDRCKQYGEDLKQRCVGADGTVGADGALDEECLAAIDARVEECILSCSEPPPQPGDACAARCQARATAEMEACLADGGDGETCKNRFERSLRACVSTCGGEDDPALPCDQECVAKARGLFQACVEAGGDEGVCRDQADGILALCVERCAGRQPCENRCALAAQVVLTGCSLGGLPSEECRRLANLVLERCVAGCQPAPTCEDRCAELARAAARECKARNGTDEECSAKAAEVLTECAASCGGEPVPPCDVQCEEKAEALVAECVRGADPAVDCAALRESFLAECLANHETDCAQELRAELTLFRSFVRGDSNRDGVLNVTDPVSLLDWLFRSGEEPPCKDASDANDDGRIDVSDAVSLLSYLFLGSEALPGPSSTGGQDSTSDGLLCEG